jgi:hypothetical protein
MGARQSSPSMIIISLGSSSIVLIEAFPITWKNISADSGILRTTTFANSSVLMFLFLSMYLKDRRRRPRGVNESQSKFLH